jgi:hypothetical protein
VIRLHSSGTYEVYMLGFLPGFRVHGRPAGGARAPAAQRAAVARAGGQRRHGRDADRDLSVGESRRLAPDRRLPVPLFSPAWPQAALLLPGDRVCWRVDRRRRVSGAQRPESGDARFARCRLTRLSCSMARAAMNAVLEVVSPGAMASIQDLGRPGLRRVGVPLAGALEPGWLRLANALLGNREDAPAIEFLAGGLVCARGSCR